jgi:hypothetical protein
VDRYGLGSRRRAVKSSSNGFPSVEFFRYHPAVRA